MLNFRWRRQRCRSQLQGERCERQRAREAHPVQAVQEDAEGVLVRAGASAHGDLGTVVRRLLLRGHAVSCTTFFPICI